MDDVRLVWMMLAGEVLVVAAVLFVLPRIARRGLLFGVYVGEHRADSDEARRIVRGWHAGIGAALLLGLVTGAAVASAYPATPFAPLVSLFVLLIATPILYLRAYRRARGLADPAHVPPPEVPLASGADVHVAWPLAAIVVGVVLGSFATAYAAWHFADLPSRVPTHFGPGGRPDRWAARSVWTVMLLPITTLVMGVALGGMGLLVAHAKRSPRAGDTGVSLRAQARFRDAQVRLLSVITILTTAMLAVMSVGAVRVASGTATALPTAIMWPLVGALVACAVGGSFYLMLRYGQGGARLERDVGGAPLTDGLADNRRWRLGVFYVNRDDPSFFVEKRFGFGYTINFGNPAAVALLILFLAAIVAIAVIGVATSGR